MNIKIYLIIVLFTLNIGPYTLTGPLNEYVLDTGTNLIWTKCSEGQTSTTNNCSGTPTTHFWDEAISICNGYSYLGKQWRLPSLNEYISIIDYNYARPALDPIFVDSLTIINLYYWTSTTHPSPLPPGGYDRAMTMRVSYGAVDDAIKNNSADPNPANHQKMYVRCVATN